MSERTTIELFSDIVAEPGQDVIVEGVLDRKFEAFLPDSFLFDDPLDWLVVSFKVHRREQLKTSLPASDMRVSLFHGGRCAPLQTRMTYTLIARPQKHGLKLRCAITGRCALKQDINILSIDAWREPEGGWTWNQWYKVGKISRSELAKLKTNAQILKYMRDEGYLKDTSKGRVTVDDDQYNYVIVDKGTRKPLFAIAYGEDQ